jgi:hypothetical protein
MSHVEDILAAARALPPEEQLAVMRGLMESLAQALSPLTASSAGFWAARPLDELANERGIPVTKDLKALAMPEWPADEAADDIIGYVREQRRLDNLG